MFECKDKDGVVVLCTKDTWENHIVAEHPEMEGWEAYVKATIEKPYRIYQDSRHTNKRNLYKPFILPKPFHMQYLRVGVKYHKGRFRGTIGYVNTAFPCTQVRKGDVLLWEEQI